MSSRFANQWSGFAGSLRGRGYYPFLLGILGVLLLVQIIRLLWLLITPLGPLGDYRASEVQVLSPQSRLSLFSSFDPFFRSGPQPVGNVVTSLQLTLYGIRMNVGSGLGSAILAGPDGVQESYAVGDEIMPGVALANVQFDHVVIDRGGIRESLYLDQSIPAETVSSEAATMMASPTARDAVGGVGLNQNGNIAPPAAAAITNAVSFAPRNTSGKVTGIVVNAQGDGLLFRAAGFRNGDIITSVNGRDVTSAADIEALKSQIAPGARISVEVERGANTVPIAINLGS